MWRSTKPIHLSREWLMIPFEHPNVDMSKVTNYVDPDTGNTIIRDAPTFNTLKAQNGILMKFRNFPFHTFAPVRVSEGSGR